MVYLENPINLLGKSMVFGDFFLKNQSIDPLTAGCLPPPAFFHCFSTGQRSARDGPRDVRGRDGSEDARSHVRSTLSADDGMMGWMNYGKSPVFSIKIKIYQH